MLKTVDVGLMANHLPAHKGVISRLELYMRITKDQQLASVLSKQIGTMKNHVQVMNQLLSPNGNTNVILPPIPQNTPVYSNQGNFLEVEIEDKDIALDAHFTATAMANENFTSANNMKNPNVKQIHLGMGMQQSDIAEQHELLVKQRGWLTHPDATASEQSQAMSPLGMNQQNPAAMNIPQRPFRGSQNNVN